MISLFTTYNSLVDCWILDDVRFKEEADYVKKMGGKLIRLEGDPGNILKDCTRDLTHVSETDLDDYEDFDLVINTNNYVGKIHDMHDIILKTLYHGDLFSKLIYEKSELFKNVTIKGSLLVKLGLNGEINIEDIIEDDKDLK